MENKRRIARRALVRAASSLGNKSRSNCSPREIGGGERGGGIPDPEHQILAEIGERELRERERGQHPPSGEYRTAELYVHLQLQAFVTARKDSRPAR